MSRFSDIETNIFNEYASKRQRSLKLYERACRVMPGGDTRTATWHKPFPSFIEYGKGFTIRDADGNEMLDFQNNYTSMLHGHTFPPVVAALKEQIERGAAFAAPAEQQIRLAEIICGRVPSVSRIRFCNSGTEATMHAIRAARAFTGRDKILKLEGGYHGTSEIFEASVDPDISRAGNIERPIAIPESKGIPQDIMAQALIAPFNHEEITEKIIEENRDVIAAFIIEPVQGSAGQIEPVPGYLRFVREITKKYGIPLIFDEVVTFRVAEGGAQQLYGIEPDMTVFGKIIGGGASIGAFGGKEEIMALYDPRIKVMTHSGTFNGNLHAMTGGIATLEHYQIKDIERINKLGEDLREGLMKAASDAGLNIRINGIASLANVIFSNDEITEYRGLAKSHEEFNGLLSLSLMNRGIFIAPRGLFCLSTVMGPEEIATCVDMTRESFLELKPAIEEVAPELLF